MALVKIPISGPDTYANPEHVSFMHYDKQKGFTVIGFVGGQSVKIMGKTPGEIARALKGGDDA